MSAIRVMIVEDSRTVRELLTHLIGCDPRLEVVAAVESGEEALRVLDAVCPDVISMDVRLPGMNGLEATQRIMARRPTPVVVVAGAVESDDLAVSLNALRAGALAVIEKPVGLLHEDYEPVAARLCGQLVNMSQVKVIRHRIDRGLRFGASEAAVVRPPPAPLPRRLFRALGVAASTGGPGALTRLFTDLPRDLPVPVFVVQHITPSFLDGFATWLADTTRWPVRLAADGENPRAGTVYLAPADRHLRVQAGKLRTDAGEPVCFQRPSGTVLLRSMAAAYGPGALGVVLTGMGDDGADGLSEIRAAGGYTIAEDESTAVVYGMPAAAVRLGAACESLPLTEIGARVVELVGRKGGA